MNISTNAPASPAATPVLRSPDPSRESMLALDLGTTTGFALRGADGAITSGTVSFRPEPLGQAAACATCASSLARRVKDQAATSSHPSTRRSAGIRRRRSACPRRLARHADGLVRAARIAYQGVPVGTIKRFITGKGNADKAAVIDAVRARGYSPADDNEADAIAILLWALETREACDERRRRC